MKKLENICVILIAVLCSQGCKSSRTPVSEGLRLKSETSVLLIEEPEIKYSDKAYDQKELSDSQFYEKVVEKIEKGQDKEELKKFTSAVLRDYIQLLNRYGKPGTSRRKPSFKKLNSGIEIDGFIEEALEQEGLSGEEKADFLIQNLEKTSFELEETMFSLSWKNLLALFEQTRIAKQNTQEDKNGVESTYDIGVATSPAVKDLNIDMYLEDLNYNVLAEIQGIDYVATRVGHETLSFRAYRQLNAEEENQNKKANSKGKEDVVKGAQYIVRKDPNHSYLVNGPRSSFVFQGLGQLSNMAANNSLLAGYFKFHKAGENDEQVKRFVGRALEIWRKSIVAYHVYRAVYIRGVARLTGFYLKN